ncbi:MAG: diaminobutyrate--2-oxoglutarate transaminase [Oscillospiraceae bacterium]|nr:diaminobutyrate--2-oxoglutarate transaminase [Oscillospiraceae bacterium]
MNTSAFENYESSVRSYCRHFPAVFNKAKGAVMYDEDGNGYIDFFCGAGALNYGHNNDYIMAQMINYLQSDGILHGMDMYTPAKRAFLNNLQEKILKPRNLNYRIMCCGPTGTNSIEAALKLARKYTGRSNVWAFMGCFHGMTLGSLAMTTESYAREAAGVALGNVTHIPAPYMFPELDVIAYMQRMLDDDHSGIAKPAALVMETVQAEGGIYPFSPEFLKGCREFCDKNDILLIVDDIQAGCGRTGTFFSFERGGIKPDMVTLSKSIGGVGMPMALLLIDPDKDIWKPAEHNGTFRGNQLAFVAGSAAIDYFTDHQLDKEVQRKALIVENFIRNEILPLDSRLSCRGIGLMWGIDCEKLGGDPFSEAIVETCFARQLILERAGRDSCVVKLMPPLVIEDDLLMKGLGIVKEAFITVLNERQDG